MIGSSSSGNCYLLHNEKECLVIEAGISIYEVKKALDFNIRKIVGVVVSHCHLDHAKYVSEYEKAGIPIFKPYDGMKDMDLKKGAEFKIQAFPNQSKDGHWFHANNDGTECPCYGFYVQHPDIGSLVYITDTECVRWRFCEVNCIMAEANYSKDLVSDIPEKRKHVLTGHMEIETTCKFLEKNSSPELRNVILLHLSGESADSMDFKVKAEKVAKCPVYVAQKGIEIDLKLLPF